MCAPLCWNTALPLTSSSPRFIASSIVAALELTGITGHAKPEFQNKLYILHQHIFPCPVLFPFPTEMFLSLLKTSSCSDEDSLAAPICRAPACEYTGHALSLITRIVHTRNVLLSPLYGQELTLHPDQHLRLLLNIESFIV